MDKGSSKYDIGGISFNAKTIDVHIGDRQGLSVEDVLKLVRGLKEDLRVMPVAPEAKSRAATALTKAESEMDFPAKGGEPDKAIVKKSLEEAAGILKGANATAEQLTGFVEKAKKIANWIGLGAEWAMTLFGS